MRSLLVTNDFPPKVGGIQSYLWELWRRLPPDDVGVLTTAHDGAADFDAAQPYPVLRVERSMLLPTPGAVRQIRGLVEEHGVELVFLDPAVPIGAVGPRLATPYVVVAHGAEITVYGRVPGTAAAMRHALRRAEGVVAAGHYPARQAMRVARRRLRGLVIPPGVDPDRFRPADAAERAESRRRFALPADRPLVVGVSRLVPRKGFDVVLDAVARLDGVHLAVAGEGRDRERLERRAAERGVASRTHFLGRVADAELPDLYACADVFAMLCRDRWAGLEAEGFGIVFLEAAAAGIPAIAGRSGGAHEAVDHARTGYVVSPRDVDAVTDHLGELLADDRLRRAMGDAARRRAVERFAYDHLAARLAPLAAGDLDVLEPLAPR